MRAFRILPEPLCIVALPFRVGINHDWWLRNACALGNCRRHACVNLCNEVLRGLNGFSCLFWGTERLTAALEQVGVGRGAIDALGVEPLQSWRTALAGKNYCVIDAADEGLAVVGKYGTAERAIVAVAFDQVTDGAINTPTFGANS